MEDDAERISVTVCKLEGILETKHQAHVFSLGAEVVTREVVTNNSMELCLK